MNKVYVSGFIGREIKVTQSGDMPIARFSLGVKRKFAKDGEQDTDWINIVCFSKLATFAEKYLTKGSGVEIVGHISTGKYTNKDGQTVYTTDVIADEIEFGKGKVDGKKAEPKKEEPQDDGFVSVDDGFADVSEDIDADLPFN